ncbi:hypothetical protein [Salana multivorans]
MAQPVWRRGRRPEASSSIVPAVTAAASNATSTLERGLIRARRSRTGRPSSAERFSASSTVAAPGRSA